MTRRAAAWLLGALALATAACGSSTKSSTPSTTPAPVSTTTAPPTTTTIPADVGAWSLIPNGFYAVGGPVAWTGTGLLVARSGCCGELGSVDLTAFDPASNTWHQLPTTSLMPRGGAAGAWTGTEMVVVGGTASPDGTDADAARLAVWTGKTVLLVGGYDHVLQGPRSDGIKWTPAV